jgi:Mrp family chromosome partitioning ATPase
MITTLGELDQRLKDKRTRQAIDRLGRKYLVLSGKGGVGKTTLAVNLAWAKAMEGRRVGLLDIDLHGPDVAAALHHRARLEVDDLGRLVPASPAPNLWTISLQNLLENPGEAVMWRGPRKMRAIIQFLGEAAWPELDYFFIDSPPGTGDETLTVLRQIPEVEAVVVSTGHPMALSDVAKALDCLKVCGSKLAGLVDNLSSLVCPGCGRSVAIHDPRATRALAESIGAPFLGSLVMDPSSARLAEEKGLPLVEAASESLLARQIREVAAKL